MIYHKLPWFFKLTIPEYETSTFGGKMGELRLVNESDIDTPITSFGKIEEDLISQGVLACTFRGKEDTQLVRYLNGLGFEFVATYRFFDCASYNFMELNTENEAAEVLLATPEDYDRILEIEKDVFDYSTYQIDPSFPNEITSYRNTLRVKYYFNNPDHVCYVIKYLHNVVGFMQFLIDEDSETAENVNSGIISDVQSRGLGTKLYSESLRTLFSTGVTMITGGVCTQNVRPIKILNAMGVKFIDHEIHLRWKQK